MMRKLGLVLLLCGSAFGANNFSDAVSVWQWENDYTDDLNNNDLTNQNGAGFTSTAGEFKIGSYALNLEVDSGTDCASITDASCSAGTWLKSGTTNTAGTVASWFRPEVTVANGQIFTIYSKHRVITGGRGVHLYITDTGGDDQIVMAHGYNSGETTETTASPLSITNDFVAGQWYHIGASIDASGGYVVVVYDLTNDQEDSMAGTYANGATSVSNAEIVVGGRRATGGSFEVGWDGTLDETVIWGKALTLTELRAVRNSAYPPASSTSAAFNPGFHIGFNPGF